MQEHGGGPQRVRCSNQILPRQEGSPLLKGASRSLNPSFSLTGVLGRARQPYYAAHSDEFSKFTLSELGRPGQDAGVKLSQAVHSFCDHLQTEFDNCGGDYQEHGISNAKLASLKRKDGRNLVMEELREHILDTYHKGWGALPDHVFEAVEDESSSDLLALDQDDGGPAPWLREPSPEIQARLAQLDPFERAAVEAAAAQAYAINPSPTVPDWEACLISQVVTALRAASAELSLQDADTRVSAATQFLANAVAQREVAATKLAEAEDTATTCADTTHRIAKLQALAQAAYAANPAQTLQEHLRRVRKEAEEAKVKRDEDFDESYTLDQQFVDIAKVEERKAQTVSAPEKLNDALRPVIAQFNQLLVDVVGLTKAAHIECSENHWAVDALNTTAAAALKQLQDSVTTTIKTLKEAGEKAYDEARKHDI